MNTIIHNPARLLALLFLAMAAFLILSAPAGEAIAHPEHAECGHTEGENSADCTLAMMQQHDADAENGASAASVPMMRTISTYVWLGFIHILPRGYDHILFVLALFLAATSLRSLLIQIACFTVAHTTTLGLAAAGLVSLPASIIEPLIALSIAVVALENILFPGMTKWRPAVIFGFGLFHGLGFAGVLSELGLAGGQFIASLLSFNVGVELGQLAVIALALIPALLVRRLLPAGREETLYRRYVVIPGSAIIAILGLYWFVSRVFF